MLRPGTVAPGNDLVLINRCVPGWTLRRLWHAMCVDRLNRAQFEAIAALEVLAEGWRRYAVHRLDSGRIEDWRPRLEGRA